MSNYKRFKSVVSNASLLALALLVGLGANHAAAADSLFQSPVRVTMHPSQNFCSVDLARRAFHGLRLRPLRSFRSVVEISGAGTATAGSAAHLAQLKITHHPSAPTANSWFCLTATIPEATFSFRDRK